MKTSFSFFAKFEQIVYFVSKILYLLAYAAIIDLCELSVLYFYSNS